MTFKYTESGLWIQKIEEGYRIGLSEKGQDDLGEVMYVELPDYGERLEKGDNLLSVEGSKAVTELVVPMSGAVQKIHKELEDRPDLMNGQNPKDIWILEITDVTDLDETELTDTPWKQTEE